MAQRRRACLHRLDGRLRAGVSGDEDDGQTRVELANAVEDLQPRQVRQAHVEDDGVGPAVLDQLQGVPAGRGVGRLAQDPKARDFDNGGPVAKFGRLNPRRGA